MQYAVILGIYNTLLSREKVSASELATKYELSVRTIMRYVDVLNTSGVPIESIKGKYGGIRISPNYRVSSQCFSETEYNRLIPAIKSYDLQDSVTASIIDKLTILSKNLRRSYILTNNQLVVDNPMTQAMQDKFALAQESIVTQTVCNISYHDNKGDITEREIEPYSLLLKDGLWYIYAFCRMRNDFRFFKITRIASISQTHEKFIPRVFADDYSKNLAVQITNPYIDFTFTLNKHVLTDVEEWLGVDCVKQEGKKYIASAKLPFDNILLSKLMSFGKDIIVTAPEKLIDEMRKTLASTLQNYPL